MLSWKGFHDVACACFFGHARRNAAGVGRQSKLDCHAAWKQRNLWQEPQELERQTSYLILKIGIYSYVYIYIRMFPCRASDASPTIASSIMRCHHCGGRFPAPNHMWEWAWNAHDSVWELCVFHQLCLLRWWNRLAAVGGA